jgi:hypothetical protein
MRLVVLIGLAAWVGAVVAEGARSFEEELALSVRIGREQLTADEQSALAEVRHPAYELYRDSNTRPILRLFANLSEAEHEALLKDSVLKWDFKDLGDVRQQVFKDMVRINVEMSRVHDVEPMEGFSVAALDRAQVGFVIVSSPGGVRIFVSLFILWADLEIPTWVTVVYADMVGTHGYFNRHSSRIKEIRPLPVTRPPAPQTVPE